jgi:hypothetical protein
MASSREKIRTMGSAKAGEREAMDEQAVAAWHDRVRSAIADSGHHVTLVQGGPLPRFAYTIGLAPRAGVELVLAGATAFSAEEVGRILDELAAVVGRPTTSGDPATGEVEVAGVGTFALRAAHASWAEALLLGVRDALGDGPVRALQVVPDGDHRTVDVPDMTRPWTAAAEPAWRWLHEAWDQPVPPRSVAVTNVAALRGKPVTEAARWEETEWELFAGAGPDVAPEDVRVVPLATLLGADPSLEAVTALPVGGALWRDARDLRWQPWTSSEHRSSGPPGGGP